MSGFAVSPAEPEDLEALLPLVAGYQRFYGTEDDDLRNRAFFARFVAPNDRGAVLIARRGDEAQLGFATLFWTFSSVAARDVALLNDLFVAAEARGRGVGRALLSAAADHARDHGAHTLRWTTAPDNTRAQGLYDRTGATVSRWLEYELTL